MATKSETERIEPMLKKTNCEENGLSSLEKRISETSPEENLTEAEPVKKNWLNVFWKIKNFRFCYPCISSIEFRADNIPYVLEISTKYTYLHFQLQCLKEKDPVIKAEISLQTWDGSLEESISGGLDDALKVQKDVFFGSRRDSFIPKDTLKIRVRIATASENESLFIHSDIGVKRKCILWTIKNFSMYAENLDDNEDRMLKTLEDSEHYGHIALFLKPESRVNSEFYSVEVSRTGKGAASYCILNVSVVDADSKALNCVSHEFVFDENLPDHYVFPILIKKSELLLCKNRFLPNDELTLKCDITLSMSEATKEIHFTASQNDQNPENKFALVASSEEKSERPDLSIDLERMLQNGPFFDVDLHVGSEVIKAHKVLLSARSSVFKSMLKNHGNGIIAVPDLDVETMRDLVLYLYTDVMPTYQREKIKRLYIAAHKYQVPSLIKGCTSLFKDNISIANACETLSFAHLHCDENLKNAVFDFMCENPVFFSLGEWKELEDNSPLSMEAMRYVINNRRVKW